MCGENICQFDSLIMIRASIRRGSSGLDMNDSKGSKFQLLWVTLWPVLPVPLLGLIQAYCFAQPTLLLLTDKFGTFFPPQSCPEFWEKNVWAHPLAKGFARQVNIVDIWTSEPVVDGKLRHVEVPSRFMLSVQADDKSVNHFILTRTTADTPRQDRVRFKYVGAAAYFGSEQRESRFCSIQNRFVVMIEIGCCWLFAAFQCRGDAVQTVFCACERVHPAFDTTVDPRVSFVQPNLVFIFDACGMGETLRGSMLFNYDDRSLTSVPDVDLNGSFHVRLVCLDDFCLQF
jgi:hypothetical protein